MNKKQQLKAQAAIAKHFGVQKRIVEFYDWKYCIAERLFIDFNIIIRNIKLRGYCYAYLANNNLILEKLSDLTVIK